MKLFFERNHFFLKPLCILLIILFAANIAFTPCGATSPSYEESFDQDLLSTDVLASDEVYITDPILADDIITDFGSPDEPVAPTAVPTNPYSNDYISIAATTISIEIGETYNLRYLLKEPGYEIILYCDGPDLFSYSDEAPYIVLTGWCPGDGIIMVYYRKMNGTSIENEGHVFINVRVQPRSGYAYIRNVDSSKFIDIAGAKTTSGTKTILWSKQSPLAANQVWRITPQEDGSCVISSAMLAKIEDTNYRLFLAYDASTNYAKISLTPTSYVLQYNISNDHFTIKLRDNPNIRLATENSGTSSGTNLKFTNDINTTTTYEWKVEYFQYTPPTSVAITSPSSATSYIAHCNDIINFSASILPTGASCTRLEWESSDSSILSINKTTGVAQANRAGTVTVTVSTQANCRTDKIIVHVYNSLNVNVFYDQSFVRNCQDLTKTPSQFIQEITAETKEKYRNDFLIDITFTIKGAYSSFPDLNCPKKNSHSEECTCSNEEDIYNYHKNPDQIADNFSPDTSLSKVNLLFTAQYTTILPNGFVAGITSSRTNGTHKIVISINRDIYQNSGYFSAETYNYNIYREAISYTLAHETGHVFGAPDHYNTPDETIVLLPDQSHDCIWGDNHLINNIFDNLIMCTSCRNTIISNSDVFNN